MIDAFAILLTHALLLLAAIRLAGCDDLDRDPPPDVTKDASGA